MDKWEVGIKKLWGIALKNTLRLFPVGISESMDQPVPMTIVTNSQRFYGATSICYPGVLEKISKEMGHGLIIIPSSVHEAIVLPDDGRFGYDEVKLMIKNVNTNVCEDGDILSYNVYRYRMESGIFLAEKE